MRETKGQYHFIVFRYYAMLQYKNNRRGKICHDSTSEQQNLNVTILKCLCVLSACRLRSAFMQSVDCPCLCQVLFSKTKQLNLLNTKDIYIYIYIYRKKFFHLTVNYLHFELSKSFEKKKVENSRIITLAVKEILCDRSAKSNYFLFMQRHSENWL